MREEFFVICHLCKTRYTFNIDPEDYYRWQHGAYVQEAFPYLTAAERELMISQTCGPCFNKLFPEEEEDDE